MEGRLQDYRWKVFQTSEGFAKASSFLVPCPFLPQTGYRWNNELELRSCNSGTKSMPKQPSLYCVYLLLYGSSSSAEVLPVTKGSKLAFRVLIVTKDACTSSTRDEDEISIKTKRKHLSCTTRYLVWLYAVKHALQEKQEQPLFCFSAAHEDFEVKQHAGNPFTPLLFTSTVSRGA